jgi:FMN-dependent oxidoreductase (nitrilotriacetate monooxygenase family)
MTRQIRFNAFDMNCVAHQSPGLWTHPRDRSWQYKDVEYWTELAATLERGIFDGIFIADVIGYYDVYKGSNYHAIQQAAQIPVNDPLQLAVPISMATKHLGIGITASTSFEHPYTFARRLSTADHLTKGRVGWNIVTSYLESGAKNIGQGGLRRHDNRYEVAEEYVEVLYKLFEGSWEEGAIVRDRARGIFAHPEKVHEIGHKGTYFDVPGYHLCEPSPQRTPVLYQAGARVGSGQIVRGAKRRMRLRGRAVEAAFEGLCWRCASESGGSWPRPHKDFHLQSGHSHRR